MRDNKQTWVIKDNDQRAKLVMHLSTKPLPFSVDLTDGIKKRATPPQNNMQHKWFAEAAQQDTIGFTAEQYRGYCKLHFGIPILRENEAYRAKYDDAIKSLSYETKIKLMMHPHDLAVTREMNRQQKSRYLNDVRNFLIGECGYRITESEGLFND